jgi:TonB family protein
MSAEIARFLLEGLLASSAACLLVLLMRRPWSRWFGPTQLRLLWVLVPAALVAVALPAPIEVTDPAGAASIEIATRSSIASADLAPPSADLLRAPVLLIWLLGSALTLLHFGRLQRRFEHHLGRMVDRGDGVCLAESAEVGPALLGLLRPRIVLPADFEQRFDHEQQTLILAHERSHLRGGDLVASAIATLLRSIYWFNPIIHLAAARMRHDHELASDAQVLQQHPHARRRYADTLLNAQLAVPGLPVGCLWQSSHPLKERLIMLKQSPHPRSRIVAGLVTGLALTLGVSALAWSMQPARQSAAEAASDPVPRVADPAARDSGPTYSALKPPRYPKEAFEAEQSGRLVLELEVDAEGKPLDVSVASSTNPGVFDAAAIDAVKGWKFNPALKDGKPVAARVQVPICFSLTDDSDCPGPDTALDGIYIRPKAPPAS